MSEQKVVTGQKTPPQCATLTEAAGEARRMLAPLQGEIVALLQELVRTDSVVIPPAGNETRAQEVLQRAVKRHGLEAELYDVEFLERAPHPNIRRERKYAGRHNLVVRLGGTGRGRSLLLNGHIDTVPVGKDEWSESPWSGSISDGRLYGRGAYDMKGGLVANFAVAIALKNAGVRLGGDLVCESVVDEEWGGGGGTLAARLRGDTADACVITEPTNLAIYRATRGGYIFDLVVNAGDSTNYFSKDEVVGPAVPVGRLLGWIDALAGRRRQVERGEAYRDFADPAPVQVLALEANRFDADIPWSVPLTSRVRVYLQFLPHEDVTGVIRDVRESLDYFCDNDSFFRLHRPEWIEVVAPPLLGHELPADHDWTRCLVNSAGAVIGEAQLTAAEYPSDAFILQREFNVPTLVFGPRGGGAHNRDEYVEIGSVLQAAEVLLTAAFDWCGTSA